MRALMIAACAALMSTAALGQVYKCKDASGRITYSNMACQGNQSGQPIMRERTYQEKLRERMEAAEAFAVFYGGLTEKAWSFRGEIGNGRE